jgi:serine/arginine repetitive matrix protein 2
MFGKPASAKAPAKAPKPFRSRINDSSDEEEDVPRRFQSRFADSDSDDDFELPSGLTPVRGIPKREEDGDSTDLEDEASDNEAPVTNGNGNGKNAATNGSSNTQGATLAAGSLRSPAALPSFDAGQKKAKRGFFGFGKKKNSPIADADSNAQQAADLAIPMPPTQQNRDRNRPLTPIGEDRDTDAYNVTTNPPSAGRAAPLERSTSDSWPLPSPDLPFAEKQRPQSADGPVKRRFSSARPTLVKRNSSIISQAQTDGGVKPGKDVSFGRTGKKKKFQGLRRVFGIHD